MNKLLIVLAAATLGTGASALIIETEPNDTPGQANVITRGVAPWSDIGVLSFHVPGDNDWFRISMFAGETITAITTPMEVQFTEPDTVMALVDPTASTVLVFNDDISGGSNRGSAWAYTVASSGDYYIAITGFHAGNQADVNYYMGNHNEVGAYSLLVGIVPEPGTLIALGLGLGALATRRRKK